MDDIVTAVVAAVAPEAGQCPAVSTDFTTVAELAVAGVRRISVGGALARTAWTGFLRAAREIAEHGTFRVDEGRDGGVEINQFFQEQ